jgi:hypothetical protein
MTTSTKQTEWHCPDWRSRLFCTIGFGLVVAVLFRELLIGCISRWTTEPQYSHGFAIPLMALGLGGTPAVSFCEVQRAAMFSGYR